MPLGSAALCAGISASVGGSAFLLLGGDSPVRPMCLGSWRRTLIPLRRWEPLRRLMDGSERRALRAGCLKELPRMLDVVTLGLLAGLSFDSALELYCESSEDGLSRELGACLLRWRMGLGSREGELGRIAGELGVSALGSFAAVVSQALSFGAPLAIALESQSQAIREEQRSELEEELERLPVRMLIPLGTLIVPAMLLAILGPLLGSSLVLA
ncbi:type II secretion system F family protein [Olsenella urininfantis]|uniref:type II secretion system F family protein n=1 Tax=Olsenella urininfantis TaxID=1871033 RepID=UPI000984C249|nr:type II secretion system F family protein [Olsenella urininfantis]